jgi:dTDP-4-dehydrorhamnose reductase
MLGRELMRRLAERAKESPTLRVTGWGSAELDIADRATVLSSIAHAGPTIVINCAAYTDVDGCERDTARAMAVNAEGPAFLAEACVASGVLLVHFSTDFVFDGRNSCPYKPDDAANPISIYGRSKRQGELAVRKIGGRSLIIRTSWLFGIGGKNFVDTILTRAKAGNPLSVVTDQLGRPTLTTDLATATLALLDANAAGTFHFANADACSWHEFAVEIIRYAGLSTSVAPMTSDKLNRPARRPAYSVLDTSDYTEITGCSIAPWRDALRRYLEQRDEPA